MNNQVVILRVVKWMPFVAILWLGIGMLNFAHALSFIGLDDTFLASNGKMLLAVFVTMIFGLGWWLENIVENLGITKGWRFTTIYMPGNLLFLILCVLQLMLKKDSFLHSIILTSVCMLYCGYTFRFSSLRSETIADTTIIGG